MNFFFSGLLWGTVAGAVSFFLGSLLWFAPWARAVSERSSDLPIWKNLPVKLFLPVLFCWGTVFTIGLTFLYLAVRSILPGSPVASGVIFGAVIWFLKNLTEGINALVLIDKPSEYVALELVNSLIGLLVTGALIAWLTKGVSV
ncbi:hypothetical protein [Spirochaeta isovalerica]|uniref:DUF1761 domain-containing protein n=1 Tax=Spirochaeta isovalerica TaxID=150 RepID=A0A841RIA0_9SPIO|nr:hypothetical protein [Spirochaeta isovalerica]MBB6482258.1 hypothetical protein [Spirochaeta isovalerica]